MKEATLNLTLLLLFLYATEVIASYKDDIAYSQLVTELGSTPTGNAGIITHVEASTGTTGSGDSIYLPDGSHSQLSSDTIIDKTGLSSESYSRHATNVGKILYGTDSIASETDIIHAYNAYSFFGTDFLNVGFGEPTQTSSRLGAHSYITTYNDSTPAVEKSFFLKHMDWIIDRDEFIQIVGVTNGASINSVIFSAAYNVLAVGSTDGTHGTGSKVIDSTYPAGRLRTEIVGPHTTSSKATPTVAATAAILIDTGHSNTELSTDSLVTSTTNRANDIIYNAELSEVIKAALLAGASRITQNTNFSEDITDYRVLVSNQSDNGLDERFGAGQVNVYNSYHVINGGEQNSSEDGGPGSSGISIYGFDYDPSFGGDNNSNTVASYTFSTSDSQILTASLVWNLKVEDSSPGLKFTPTATFYDFDLHLYDVTSEKTLLVNSSSIINNSENIWTPLSANKDYLLEVTPKAGQNSFDWDYALAWRLDLDSDSNGVADSNEDNNDGLTDTEEGILKTLAFLLILLLLLATRFLSKTNNI